jgi:hypothetical protein
MNKHNNGFVSSINGMPSQGNDCQQNRDLNFVKLTRILVGLHKIKKGKVSMKQVRNKKIRTKAVGSAEREREA